ncbi:hypothetical protein, partial [uncultured Mucilaginibacter sp.]|uniref:hypothetical protein n=1 Tax=uncultured Mucilaginibacter sp. TaxID=797541 RepID=UPI0025D68DC8
TMVLLFAINCFGIDRMIAQSTVSQADPFSTLKSNGYKRVISLKGKNGELLGDLYVKENPKYTNHVLTALLVVRPRGLKLDTLYQINAHGDFINTDGKIELKNHVKDYYGFKLFKEKKGFTDLFTTGEVDRTGRLYSDDNDYLIDWDYNTKKFEYYPAP